MEAVDKIYAYGERPQQPMIEREGTPTTQSFPKLDYVRKATT